MVAEGSKAIRNTSRSVRATADNKLQKYTLGNRSFALHSPQTDSCISRQDLAIQLPPTVNNHRAEIEPGDQLGNLGELRPASQPQNRRCVMNGIHESFRKTICRAAFSTKERSIRFPLNGVPTAMRVNSL